ncbi:MAG: hypothetical protein ACAI37_17985 [Chthoniobacter sp.]
MILRNCFMLISAAGILLGSTWASAEPSKGPSQAWSDPTFNQPYVDVDEWRDKPLRHRYVHGGFKGTEARFSFYFPPKEQYTRRFFQWVTPIPLSENAAIESGAEDSFDGSHLAFSIEAGAYFVQTNQGGPAATGKPGEPIDPAIAGYRVNAAAAQYSRVIAAEMYGPHRPYGYPFGGSGGGFRTIGGMENTTGVWDGAVPFVIGSPMAIPNVFTVRLHAMRILKSKFPGIVDALEPGGSGDMYAGLNDEERAALLEATRMGFPPRAWIAHDFMGMGAFSFLMDSVLKGDPTYVDDFWSKPGYLGTDPKASIQQAHVQHVTKLRKLVVEEEAKALKLPTLPLIGGRGSVEAWRELVSRVPVALQFDSLPSASLEGTVLLVKSGENAGHSFAIGEKVGDLVTLKLNSGDAEALAKLKVGDDVQIDNSAFLALQTYHRHQVPPTRDFYVWDQFRGPDGEPLYPQRPMLAGPRFAESAAGSVQNGRFNGKMIVVEALMDWDAFPWQADWYRSKVREALGSRLDDHFRLWYFGDSAHGPLPPGPGRARFISYVGALHQALLDVSAWAEKGVAPPSTTQYQIVDGQVEVPATAKLRKGIQPVVKVMANGSSRAEVEVGTPVEFSAVIEVPPGTGKVVGAQWDFEGAGDYPVTAQLDRGSSKGQRVTVKVQHAFSKPGTYFPVLRASSQRDASQSPYTKVQALGRVRVVVR